jgi:hypothetical protein
MTTDTSMRSSSWGGWIAFAGWLMLVIGMLDFFEGLIAVIRGQYYVLTSSQVIVFDVKTWGWLTLLWGIVLGLAGIGLLAGSSFARWFAIVVGTLTFLEQLAFVGSATYPLWSLVVLTLTALVLYALIVRWHDSVEPL